MKEWGHTLLLGWSASSISFIEEICLANKSAGGKVIVVMSERDKEEMETELLHALSIEGMWGTRVVFRSGSPVSLRDLKRAG